MNDRGVSVTINYTLGLAIATLLMSGLLFASGGMLEDRRETAQRNELDVVGQRIAVGLMTADRLAEAGGDEIEVDVEIPGRVGGTSYDVAVNPAPGGSYLLLTAQKPSTQVNVSFRNHTAVEPTTISGGNVRIVLAGDGELEVRSA